MFGNMINNTQIIKLIKSKEITFFPFDKSRLKLAHYSIRPAGIVEAGQINSKGEREYLNKHSFHSKDDYIFQPREYAIVEIEELIALPSGIVGHFIPSSSLVERGFGFTGGKVDPGYGVLGGSRQKLRFGLFNLKNDDNVYSASAGFAHVYFVDFRGLNNDPYEFSPEQIAEFMRRYPRFVRARDDGVQYEED